jgi:hypothetical protein
MNLGSGAKLLHRNNSAKFKNKERLSFGRNCPKPRERWVLGGNGKDRAIFSGK